MIPSQNPVKEFFVDARYDISQWEAILDKSIVHLPDLFLVAYEHNKKQTTLVGDFSKILSRDNCLYTIFVPTIKLVAQSYDQVSGSLTHHSYSHADNRKNFNAWKEETRSVIFKRLAGKQGVLMSPYISIITLKPTIKQTKSYTVFPTNHIPLKNSIQFFMIIKRRVSLIF